MSETPRPMQKLRENIEGAYAYEINDADERFNQLERELAAKDKELDEAIRAHHHDMQATMDERNVAQGTADDCADLIAALKKCLAEARATNSRLNRRCQAAEAAVTEKLTGHEPNCGRALLAAGYQQARNERDALKELIAKARTILIEAKDTIRVFHGKPAWTTYESQAPEMTRLNNMIAELARAARGKEGNADAG